MDELRMSAKERIRLEAFGRVKRKELTVVEAAALCDLSLRQGRRVWKRFKTESDAGLVHRLRGRTSNRRLPEEVRQRVVKIHQEHYSDFGPTLACEKLQSEHELAISPDTLAALLKERGLWERRRRRGKHRKRRERRSCFGSMVQMDGSHHDWFEGRAPKCVLMVIIDDATSRVYARFYRAETTEAAFDVFRRWIHRHGIPRGVYVDRHGIYRDEDHPEKPTQFGRAMKQLNVELIRAHSPQAKGRVERYNAVFQDRLVKEMRLRKISSIEQANALLENLFLEDLNDRYAVDARKQQDLHRAVDAQIKLDEVLCVSEPRVVGQDWCVRWKNRWLQIDKRHENLRLAGKRVLVKQKADGELIVEHKGERLSCDELSQRPEPRRKKKPAINNRNWKPAADHPWNRTPACRADPRGRLAPAPAPAAPSPAPERAFPAAKRKTG
jgi:transposase